MSHTFKTAKGTELPVLSLKGKDYLEVKYRLIWFREEKPNWRIETEFITITDRSGLAKATISNDVGNVMSTSHKFEDAKGFPDFLEKAETGAIGRALALIGYGTQFCGDELNEGSRIVDSPVSRVNPLQHAAKSMQPHPSDGHAVAHETGPYRVTFGKYAKRSLHEIDAGDLAEYCEYLERTAAKNNKPLGSDAVELIQRAREHLALSEPFEPEPLDLNPLASVK